MLNSCTNQIEIIILLIFTYMSMENIQIYFRQFLEKQEKEKNPAHGRTT